MDIGSVVKADRDIRVTRTSKIDSDGLKAKIADNVEKSHNLSFMRDAVWDQESIISQTSVRNSDLVEESKMAQERRYREEQDQKEQLEQKRQDSEERAREVIESLNSKRLALRFDKSEDYEDASVVNVIDAQTSEVLRQIPSEEILRVQASIREYEQRLAHNEMMADPVLKAKGVDRSDLNEDMRGITIDFIA